MIDSLRGTGRTTRMLEQAIAASEAGKRVVVVVANEREAERIGYLLRRHPDIIIHNVHAPLRGIRATVFVDHHVYDYPREAWGWLYESPAVYAFAATERSV